MKRRITTLMTFAMIVATLLAACAAPATQAPATPVPPTAAAPTAAAPAAADIKGMKVCYLIPALGNTFLNELTKSVKAKAAADGVEVLVFGADEGGATQQFSQIENCISMGVKAMIVMAPGSIENVLPAVQEAKKAGIKVIGVPPGDLEPFDAIMHTDQLEDGTKMAEMACNFINATYPEAADKSIEVVTIANQNQEKQMNLRYTGMLTIEKNCPKAKLVQNVDQTVDGMPAGASTAENVLTAHPNVKVFLVQSSALAQGVAQTIKALPNVDISKYGVFAGDMDPTMIETVKSCKDPYKGLVAIGGTNLDQATYDLLKKLLQGVDYPKITNDALEPIFCEAKTEAAPTAAGGAKPVLAVALPALDNPLMLAFQDAFKKVFGDKFDVQVASADGNAVTQATQVENFTAMKVKFMFIMAVEPTSLVPKLVAARQAGVTVLFAGGDPGDPNAYDAVMKMDQFLSGEYAALMAKQWVAKTYPDAAAGSIETALFESTLNPEAVARSQGLKMISEPYLKDSTGAYIDAKGTAISDASGKYLSGKSDADRVANPVYTPAVKIVQTVQAEMFQAGQTAMQNILTTNPKVKLVLAYAGDGGMGASKAIMDEYAKGKGLSAIDDLSQVAVFSVGMIGAEGPAVADSSKGNGVFRGTIRFGGDLIGRTMEYATKMVSGADYPKIIWDTLDMVTADNGQLMALPVESSGVITVPTAKPQPLVLPGP